MHLHQLLELDGKYGQNHAVLVLYTSLHSVGEVAEVADQLAVIVLLAAEAGQAQINVA
jgi:hypothetical protein